MSAGKQANSVILIRLSAFDARAKHVCIDNPTLSLRKFCLACVRTQLIPCVTWRVIKNLTFLHVSYTRYVTLCDRADERHNTTANVRWKMKHFSSFRFDSFRFLYFSFTLHRFVSFWLNRRRCVMDVTCCFLCPSSIYLVFCRWTCLLAFLSFEIN